MKDIDAFEQAYKNGYSAAVADMQGILNAVLLLTGELVECKKDIDYIVAALNASKNPPYPQVNLQSIHQMAVYAQTEINRALFKTDRIKENEIAPPRCTHTAHWIDLGIGLHGRPIVQCDACKDITVKSRPENPNYCKNCGAYMKEPERKEENDTRRKEKAGT